MIGRDLHNAPNKTRFTSSWLIPTTIAVLSFASVPTLAKSTNLSTPEIVFWVNISSLPVLGFFVFAKGSQHEVLQMLKSNAVKAVGVGLEGNLIYQFLYFAALDRGPAGPVVVVSQLAGVLAVVGSAVFWNERHRKWEWFAVIAAFAGAGIVSFAGGSSGSVVASAGFLEAILMALLAAGAYALYTLQNRYWYSSTDEAASLLLYKLATLSLALPIWLIWLLRSGASVIPSGLWAAILIGVMGDGIGFVAYLRATKGRQLSAPIAVLYIRAPLALALLWLFVGEPIRWFYWLSVPLIVVPVAIAEVTRNRARVRSLKPPNEAGTLN